MDNVPSSVIWHCKRPTRFWKRSWYRLRFHKYDFYLFVCDPVWLSLGQRMRAVASPCHIPSLLDELTHWFDVSVNKHSSGHWLQTIGRKRQLFSDYHDLRILKDRFLSDWWWQEILMERLKPAKEIFWKMKFRSEAAHENEPRLAVPSCHGRLA